MMKRCIYFVMLLLIVVGCSPKDAVDSAKDVTFEV